MRVNFGTSYIFSADGRRCDSSRPPCWIPAFPGMTSIENPASRIRVCSRSFVGRNCLSFSSWLSVFFVVQCFKPRQIFRLRCAPLKMTDGGAATFGLCSSRRSRRPTNQRLSAFISGFNSCTVVFIRGHANPCLSRWKHHSSGKFRTANSPRYARPRPPSTLWPRLASLPPVVGSSLNPDNGSYTRLPEGSARL